MKAKVYGIPGSHPVKAAMLMLEHKGVEATRTDLPNVVCRPVLRAMGFPGPTVPAVKIDGRRVQTTRSLARVLDELRPDPPLFPSDPALRTKVEEAERWGDEVLQGVPRRLSFSSPMRRNKSDFAEFFEGPLLGLPPSVAVACAGPLFAAGARVNKATDDAVRGDLAALPGMLGHVDALIGEGVIGGAQRNAADFQIASSLRTLMCFDDIRPAIEGRSAERLAREVAPSYPGHVRPGLPADWLALLRPAAA
ncbi:MAG: glutathione S-transferase [Thermoleophilaceae bacterium]|nr:glutathione S-transferase [Thermoleophilaceae bacterium]